MYICFIPLKLYIYVFIEHVSFWFDTIHCYCSTMKKGRLDPPIIVVCTNEDQFKVNLSCKCFKFMKLYNIYSKPLPGRIRVYK